MNLKSSAHYQREFRRRLREKGLVKKEVWILPEHTSLLAVVEKKLREADVSPIKIERKIESSKKESKQTELPSGGVLMAERAVVWTTATLHTALESSEMFQNKQASLEMIEGIEPSLYIVMHEYGDLPIFLSVHGEQILAESVLWSMSEVINAAECNESILRTHKYFPLSTISIDKLSDGNDYYIMFGALSSASTLGNVLSEIDALANNVIQATEAYSQYLLNPSDTE